MLFLTNKLDYITQIHITQWND